MDKEFSEGFILDIADLLELCMKKNTDNITINLLLGDTTLNVDITFSVN